MSLLNLYKNMKLINQNNSKLKTMGFRFFTFPLNCFKSKRRGEGWGLLAAGEPASDDEMAAAAGVVGVPVHWDRQAKQSNRRRGGDRRRFRQKE